MANYDNIKATINANIKTNGNQEISGSVLNSVLNQMVNTLGAGYQFAGVATTATNPGTPDAKVFYIANGKGTYTNFGGINVTEDEVVVLYYDTEWHKVATGIASNEKLTELERKRFFSRNIAYITGKYLDYNGNEVSAEKYNIMDYVPVNEMEKLFFLNTISQYDTLMGVVFYDSNKAFLSSIRMTSLDLDVIVGVDIPQNASYVRMSVMASKANDFRAYTIPLVFDTSILEDLESVVGQGVNLISSWTIGRVIVENGNDAAEPNYSVSNYVPVLEGVKYYGSIFGSRYAFYDEKLRFVTGYKEEGILSVQGGFTIPANRGIKFARFSYKNGTDVSNAFLSDYSYFPPKAYQEYIKDKSGRKFISPGDISIDNLNFIKHNPDTDMIRVYATHGYITNSGIVEETPQDWSYTDFIEIQEGERYYIKGNYAKYTAFYDANRDFVSNKISGWFVVPAGVKYIRASWNSLDKTCFLSKYSGELKPFAYQLDLGVEYPTDYKGEEISVFKKIICIGDSLTAGVFNVASGSPLAAGQMQYYNYPLFLKKITGVDCSNYGVGGITTPEWFEQFGGQDLSGYDCAIIQLGVNDGSWSDNVKTAYDNIITKMRSDNKDIVIFISTIIRSDSYGQSTAAQEYNQNLKTYVANRNEDNTVLLDMNTYGHLIEGLGYNAGHLTALGYWRLAADYKSYISWYIHTNRDLFRFVQFIGTNCFYS